MGWFKHRRMNHIILSHHLAGRLKSLLSIHIGYTLLITIILPACSLPLKSRGTLDLDPIVKSLEFTLPATFEPIKNEFGNGVSLLELNDNRKNSISKIVEASKDKSKADKVSLTITNKDPFKPGAAHSFAKVTIDKSEDHVDLKDPNGVLVGRFKINTIDPDTVEQLEYISRNKDANCNVKWLPKSDKNGGQVKFSCSFNISASGYSGDTPINIKITGLSGLSKQIVHLSTDGYSFLKTYENVSALKRDIMSSLGADPLHKCSILEVNERDFRSDEKAFEYITHLILKGVGEVKVKIEPLIKLEVNVKHAFSKVPEGYMHDVGYYKIREYKSILRKKDRLHNLTSKLFGKNASDFTLVAINNKYSDAKGYKFRVFSKMQILMTDTWTLTPYVKINYHYLDTLISSRSLPAQAGLLKIVKDGEALIKKHFKNVKRAVYKLHAYSLPGCLQEEDNIYDILKKDPLLTLEAIPVAESCVNRGSDELNLYYLNDKPSVFNFEVEIFNPDGTLSLLTTVTLDYVEKANLRYLKEAIISVLEKDGHLVSTDDLTFIDLRTDKGEKVEDDTLISKLTSIIKEQKLGKKSHVKLSASPKVEAIFTNAEGKTQRFKVHLKSTRPSINEIKDSYEHTLHERSIIKPDEHLHSELRVHPKNAKDKVNMKIDIHGDKSGYLPAGTKAGEIAVESDYRVEIPVNFKYNEGKDVKFTLKLPYGSSEQQIKDLILKEIKNNGIEDAIPDLYINVKGGENSKLGRLWDNNFDKTEVFLNAEPAVPLEVEGEVHNIPLNLSVKVHPHESVEELEDSVLTDMRSNPHLDAWLKSDPKHANDVTTLITDEFGKAYEDNDLKTADVLFKHRDRISLGVSDHPLDLVWKDPLTNKEFSFCFSKREDGRCRGVPQTVLSKFSARAIGDHLLGLMKKDDTYEKVVVSAIKNRKDLTSTVKLMEIRLVDGKVIECDDLQADVSFPLLSYLYNVDLSQIRSLVYSLMTQEQYTLSVRRQKEPNSHNIILTKTTGDKESHLLNSGEMTPEELKRVIYKYFHNVPFDSEIENIKINGNTFDSKLLSDLLRKSKDSNEPIKITFGLKDDKPQSKYTLIDSVTIQPKHDETLREYFDRAMMEPGDYGLSPMHGYTLRCLDENGQKIKVDNLLDTPMDHLTQCKEIKFDKNPTTRADLPTRIVMNATMDSPVESIDLDENKDEVYTLNSKLRKFLLDIPEGQMDHVNILINNKPVKCSLNVLREAYRIKHITIDDLLDLCNVKLNETEPSVIHLKLDVPYKEMTDTANYKLLNGIGNTDSPPVAHFTLLKGQQDLGVSSLVKITPGTLKSPVQEFYAKLLSMFGSSINSINNINILVVKNGRSYPCDNSKVLSRLGDFKKVPLLDLFKICDMVPRVPENGTFLNFLVILKFGNNIASTNSMGATVPLDILMDDDERSTTVHYDEDLTNPIEDYLLDNPNFDPAHLDRYTLTIRGEEPNHNTRVKNFNLAHLPERMTLSDVFPHSSLSNINLQLYDMDETPSGDWRTEMSYPATDFKNNFDGLKRQILLNLKTMHGDNLNNIDNYIVKVGINGVKHQCRIDNLSNFVNMNMKQFISKCVNIERYANNPTVSLGVEYESPREKKFVNIKCVCADNSVLSIRRIGLNEAIPDQLVNELVNKYGKPNIRQASWSVFINKMRGDCHIGDITKKFKIADLLDQCGVDDPYAPVYNVTLQDMDLDLYGYQFMGGGNVPGGRGAVHAGKVGSLGGREGRSSRNLGNQRPLHSNARVRYFHPDDSAPSSVHITMPQDYTGPRLEMSGNNSLNDYTRSIILSEDEYEPGVPINMKIYSNDHLYTTDNIPRRMYNYPSNGLNGNVSIVVKEDPTGRLPGTLTTVHLPKGTKPLSEYLNSVRRNNPNKKVLLVNRDTMLPDDRIPATLLNRPVGDLGKSGYRISLLNPSDDGFDEFHINILSKDGVTDSVKVTDLQQPLHELFRGIGDVDKVANSKFRIIIDGFDTNCSVPNLKMLSDSISLQNLLHSCGITDLDHSHDITVYFDSEIGDPKRSHDIEFNVDIGDSHGKVRKMDFSSEFDIGSDGNDFLKNKKNGHIFVDLEGDNGYNEFIEIDSEKFRQLLNGHPDLVTMLLKFGIPQDHLGGLHSLKLILSTLSKALNGHQKFSINDGEDANFTLTEPISKEPSIAQLQKSLAKDKDLDVRVVVQLANNAVEEFTVKNRDFMHALHGNLTFRDLALFGINAEDADAIKHVSFYTGNEPHTKDKKLRSEDDSKAPPKSKTTKMKSPKMSNEEAKVEIHGGDASHPGKRVNSGGVLPITLTTLVKNIPKLQDVVKSPTKSVELEVKTRTKKVYKILVHTDLLRNMIGQGKKMQDLLTYFMQESDLSMVDNIMIRILEKTKKFYVPLIKHTQIAMPIMGSDEPRKCMIQEFKNAWNPPDEQWRNYKIKEAIEEYGKKFKIDKQPLGVYLLMKEDHNNLSAQVIYDEHHEATPERLDRNLADDVSKGYTLFLRYRDTGELVQ